MLINLLIGVIILAIVFWVAQMVLAAFPIPQQLRQIILAIIALIVLIWLLTFVGVHIP